ncbi:hypothetical protein [Desulfarculus baarsii]
MGKSPRSGDKQGAPTAKGRGRTVKDYHQALEMARGYPAVAAELLGVTPAAVTHMVKRHGSLAKLYDDLRTNRNTRNLDMAEEKLRSAVEEGKPWAVRYVLDSHGGERGYGSKLQLSGEVTANVTADPLADYLAMPAERRREKIAELMSRLADRAVEGSDS